MISIIVPIYNVSQYLLRCVDSILTQTFQDLEVILVDDGSTDGSSRMCDVYASKDARIRVIHKQNGGLSDARNVGMREAKGEWVYFLDSDDWMHADALMQLYSFAKQNHCEVVQGNLFYAYSDRLLYREPNNKEKQQHVLSRNEAMRLLIINDRVKNFAWGKLYQTELIRDLEFPVGKFYEDSFWQHLVMDRVNHYGIIDTPLYYYRQREDSISGTVSNKMKDLIEGYTVRLSFINQHYPQYASLMRKTLRRVCLQFEPRKDAWTWIQYMFQRIENHILPHAKYNIFDYNTRG